MGRSTHGQMKKIVSPVSEHTFQNDQACIRYLNSSLAEFFRKIERPVNASVGILRIGPIVEEIVNKLNQNGRNFYVEQMAIQKLDFKVQITYLICLHAI
ncbi:hypothetical protein GHT06_020613 [Daphnia sinensis]|uniref:Uncharacterized protein n=1 Tax=Daphnia sinensis TaxID=1820382 RepID=A0AAD5PQ46_9CRUS|nr:hypothetical protein GHT06_020613 [Daphnia sinensis]